MPADKAVVRYRQCAKKWNARGWRVDNDQLERDAGKEVYAIPSPPRREAKGWVTNAVPVVQAGGAKQAAV